MSLFTPQLPTPENNVYIVLCPRNPNPAPNSNPLANYFPIQVTDNPGPHRIGRHLSYLEYLKRALNTRTDLLTTSSVDPTESIAQLSFELAYLGFPMFSLVGEPIRPLSNTILRLIPQFFPQFLELPTPTPGILDVAHKSATLSLQLAAKNRRGVAAHRKRQTTPDPDYIGNKSEPDPTYTNIAQQITEQLTNQIQSSIRLEEQRRTRNE